MAEGVETVEQMEQPKALGCDRMQGYLFARPSPVAAMDEFLAATADARDGITDHRYLSASGL